MENMIVMPITKRMEIIISFQVCFNSRMNFDYKRNGGKKLFLQIKSINIMHPNMENMIVLPMTKRMEIMMSIKVCPISLVNFDYKENGGNKACKSKASTSWIPMRTT